jgi:hypothetical protein
MIVALLSVSSGLVLDTVTRGRREMKLLAYLSQLPNDMINAVKLDTCAQGDRPRAALF